MMEEKSYIDGELLFIAIVSLTITFLTFFTFILTRLSKIRKKEAKLLDEFFENRGGIVARGPGRPWPPRQNWMI